MSRSNPHASERTSFGSTKRKLDRRVLQAAVPIGVLLLLAGVVLADYWTAVDPDVMATFVGRQSCVQCHSEQAKAFENSHHDLAMDLATDATVLGNFDNVTFEHDGIQSRMFRDGSKFMIHTEGPDGKLADFEVKYVFGVEPLQQYMVEFDRDLFAQTNEIGRLQVLRLSWDTTKKKWFYLRPPDVAEKLEPVDPLHWTGVAQRWQTMCADCHSTNLQKNFDVATDRYHTTFSEIDVSCEACHGPGSLHVQFASSNSLFWDRNHGYGLAKLKDKSNESQLQACAPCHSRRGVLDTNFVAGNSFYDHYQLETLGDATYYPDGQIKDEVYEIGSFVQSKMYHKDIRCTDCHDPHSLKLKHPGNATCTSCHQHSAGKFDVVSHHHHQPGTPGSMCVDCHMPHRTYMEVDPRRDHSLRVPRPDLSVELGTPNACTGCHVKDRMKQVPEAKQGVLGDYADWLEAAESGDETIASLIEETDRWCNEACDRWYGDQRKRSPHFAEWLAPFRKSGMNPNDAAGIESLATLATMSPEVVPAIARASALSDLAGTGSQAGIAAAEAVLKNPHEVPLVRSAAIGVLVGADPFKTKRLLLPLLEDPVRIVRNEAARILVSTGAYQQLTPSERTRVDLSLRDVHEALMASSDRSGSHMAWAMLCERQGRAGEAIQSYETASRLEPLAAGPRTNLAALLEQLANQQQGPQSLQLIARAEALRAEELPLLARDARLAPENADIQYRYGLALYLHGDHAASLKVLERAVELAPSVKLFKTAVRLLKEKIESEN